VLRDFLPAGVRGLVLAGLLAAFMSTFSPTLNAGAAFLVRDLWQPYLRPDATDRQAVRAGYAATVLLVLAGIAIGFQGQSIARIWSWMMMALGGGVIVPNVLRWHWARMNGWGYAFGVLGGMALALVSLLFPGAPVYAVFPLVALSSLAFSVIASLLTEPVDEETLVAFYETGSAFGLWRAVRRRAVPGREEARARSDRFPLIALNVGLGMAAISGAYLFPMYLVAHAFGACVSWLGVCLASCAALKFTWYDRLPPPGG